MNKISSVLLGKTGKWKKARMTGIRTLEGEQLKMLQSFKGYCEDYLNNLRTIHLKKSR